MNIQKLTTNPKLSEEETKVALKECYLTIQETLLKMTYKTEEEQERKEWQELMAETGKNYEKMLEKLKTE